jgi:hypothetical protein
MQPGRAELNAHTHEPRFLEHRSCWRTGILAAGPRAALIPLGLSLPLQRRRRPKLAASLRSGHFIVIVDPQRCVGTSPGAQEIPPLSPARERIGWIVLYRRTAVGDRMRKAHRSRPPAARQNPTDVFTVASKAARARPRKALQIALCCRERDGPFAARNARRSEGAVAAIADLEHFPIRLAIPRVCKESFALFFGNLSEKRGDRLPKSLNSTRLRFA